MAMIAFVSGQSGWIAGDAVFGCKREVTTQFPPGHRRSLIELLSWSVAAVVDATRSDLQPIGSDTWKDSQHGAGARPCRRRYAGS